MHVLRSQTYIAIALVCSVRARTQVCSVCSSMCTYLGLFCYVHVPKGSCTHLGLFSLFQYVHIPRSVLSCARTQRKLHVPRSVQSVLVPARTQVCASTYHGQRSVLMVHACTQVSARTIELQSYARTNVPFSSALLPISYVGPLIGADV